MFERIIEFSIRNRLLVVFFVLLVGALGVRAAQELPIDAVPDVTNVQVQVLTTAPALGPLEVEQFVTFPVETVMGGLPSLKQIRSVSKFGLSAVTIVFEDGTDIYFARQLVAERLAEAREAIPEGYGMPEMGPISSGLGEIYQFEVRGEPMCEDSTHDTDECYTPMELRTILDWYVAYQLRTIPGVVEVNTFGGELKTFEVQLEPARLTSFNLSVGRVFEAIENNNANAGGAYLIRGGEQYLIRGEGLVQTLHDIRSVVVSTPQNGAPITIGDLGRVTTAPMVRQGAVTRDGRGEVVTGIAMMLMGANSREVARDVEAKVQSIRPTLPPGVTIETFYDRTILVNRTIRTVAINLIEGGTLVIVVLLLLLGNLRAGLLVASAIPLSMLAAFIAMRLAGLSGNLMSLGALDFGLIVDGSVVMAENIARLVSQRRARGDKVIGVVASAGREVARPVVFAVSIILIVYLPVLTLEGIEGKMFRPMALTVVFALAASLVLALTWIPAMATFVFRRGVAEREPWIVRKIAAMYHPVLRRAVASPWKTFLVAVGLFFGSLVIVPFIGTEFVPRLDEGAMAIQAIRLPSVSLEESVRATTRVEQSLLDNFPDEIETVVSKTGRPEIATDPMGVDISDIFVILKSPEKWQRASSKAELVEAINKTLTDEVPGQRFSFSQPIELRTNELISGVRSDVAISVYGDDLDEMRRIGDQIVRVINGVPGAADVKAEQVAGLPFLRVRIKRDQIARYGVNAVDVLDAVSAMGGRQVGEVFEGQRRFALQVRYATPARSSLEAIRRIPIAAADGRLVPLGQLAELLVEDGPAQISRDRIQRRLTVEANVRGRDLGSFVAEARERIAGSGVIPPGYYVEWGGQFKNLAEASARLLVVVPVALLSIFLLLYMAYGSARPALIIYLNVPFAATGGLVALWVRDMPFSISAGVGFIALFGIAVLNGVVLISYVRKLQSHGAPPREAAIKGAMIRLRPVLMTALVASLGFVPMALATSAGAEVQRPLASVVIGGLITSTLLTLLVLPAVYGHFGEELDKSQKARPKRGSRSRLPYHSVGRRVGVSGTTSEPT
ncbi:MAG: CusA/CzcA family heavy metal efflux RND transporter [Proteobacteria bacterium]|nr:CusA/CzcA family heavy metal efflux RND transporter [Pseudomonadota bacterium]